MTMLCFRAVCTFCFLFAVAEMVQGADPTILPPEQKVLDRFIGNWRTTYKIPKSEGNPEEKVGAADLSYGRVLGGQFVQEQGVHADKTTGLAMYTYDAQRKSFRSWWFFSSGQTGESTGKWDADARTLIWTSVSVAGQGLTTTSRHRFINEDAFDWDVVVQDAKNQVLFRMEGKANRAKK